ncbi:MAG: hypothetical protein E7Z92_03790 [Cyanobacteria bacterium SIG31]|nr:hypothetical protein [Cyanobacteria bacterium SIG31]
MQVNNSINPSFKGLYIIKGTGKKVARATSLICEKCSDPVMQEILREQAKIVGVKYNPQNIIPNFLGVTYHALTGYFDEKQPLVKNIIATNEHTPIVDEYQIKEGNFQFLNDIEDFNEAELEMMKNCFINELHKFQRDLYNYETAQKECFEKGNSSLLTKFIINKAIEAKKILNKMLIPHKINPAEIKTLDADTVLDAIYQDKFNCIDGSFKGDI